MIRRVASWSCFAAGLGLAALTVLFGYIWAERASLTYNAQGRFLGGEVVYDAQATPVYAAMTLACGLLALLFAALGRWLGRKKRRPDG
ncbi:hypothetical protein [Hyphobacterium indicum]|uniref:hypothetical protein n=1 Tax=Hyphobacterium indicum TaxID=2162714 RepID=UPI000D65B65B|nr:hypothetical protein [Hyphobacterium indicum]